MTTDELIYYPQGGLWGLVVVLCGFDVIFFMLFLFCLNINYTPGASVLLAILMGSILIMMWASSRAKTKIIFKKELVEVYDKKGKILYSRKYEDMPYAFYGNNQKGRPYLVLSSEELEIKQVRWIVIDGSNYNQSVIDDCIVVPLGDEEFAPDEESRRIKEIVNAKILHVKEISNLYFHF